MCGRLDQHGRTARYAEYLGGDPNEQWGETAANYNITPGMAPLAAYYDFDPPSLIVANTMWGFVPGWAKDDYSGPHPINARAETVAKSPMFRHAFQSSRCLIPAEGYYEWRTEGGKKQPYYFRLRSGDPMFMAGVMTLMKSATTFPTASFAIIVGPANEVTRPIHDRMPIILPAERWQDWLAPDNRNVVGLERVLQPYPPGEMECYAVSRLVNNPKSHTGPECIEPLNS